jgi:hypothetical protein
MQWSDYRMINNNIELLGFTTVLSNHVSLFTNEIELTQKDMMNLFNIGRKKLFESLQALKELNIIISKYDLNDNRQHKYYFHPYIFFQGELNISVLNYLFGLSDELKEPFEYIIIKDNEVMSNMVNNILETQERFVYFIQNESNQEIKIGVTSNIEKRMNDISRVIKAPVKLLKLIKGNEVTEKELHNKFSQYRIHGEWFAPSKELIKYIDQI